MKTLDVLALALAAVAFAGPVSAQEFPARPVRVVVPFPPGGALDVAARLIGQHLGDRWKQPMVVENRPGSVVGTESVVKSAPDGYTLVINASTPLITLPQMQKVPYDVLRDLVGITQTTVITYALMVHPRTGIGSIQELIERARREPGRMNYASAGNGSGQHLLVELLKTAAGINLTHVPYKGAGPAVNAALAGEVDMMLENTQSVVSVVKSGRMRALLVTGSKPLEQLPGAVPLDQIYPGVDIRAARHIRAGRDAAARAGATRHGHTRGTGATCRGRALPRSGTEPSGVSGDRFNEIVRRDFERWGEIIRRNNLRVD